LRDLLEPIRSRHDLPALAVCVICNGKIEATEAVGLRSIGTKVKVTAADEFHLGSCTKAMTATLIASLVEEGRLSWTTTIAQGLPRVAKQIRPEYRDVTLDQLLCHHAGLPAETFPKGPLLDAVFRLRTVHEQRLGYAMLMLNQEPEAPPGSRYLYSNTSYIIAGTIAEVRTGVGWEELMRRRIFRPLRMGTAGFGPAGTPGRLNQPLGHKRENGRLVSLEPGPAADNPPLLGPAGTVHVSLGDWAKFVIDHLRGARGQRGLLHVETYRHLHAPPSGSDYAFGWLVLNRPWGGGTVLHHAGTNTFNYAMVWAAPERDFAVLIGTNVDDFKACDEVAAAVINEFAERKSH
jgi:CubicO group peptidase (beta-lactamase class C family)